MFEERLGSYQHDVFVIMAVLAVGIGLYFHGFSMEKQLLWPISCIFLTKRTFKIFTNLDRNILKILLTVSSDIPCSVKAVDLQNKKKKKNKMEKWAYFIIHQKT